MPPISPEMFEVFYYLLTRLLHLSDTLWAAIIGGAMGGLLSLTGVWYSQSQTEKTRKKRELEELRILLASIRTELQTIWERYSVTLGPEIEKIEPGKGLYAKLAISHEMTTIYDANASKIGMITDDELRTKIVATYVWIKTLIDSLQVNGDYYDQFRNYVSYRGGKDSFSQVTEDLLQRFGQQLKATHERLERD